MDYALSSRKIHGHPIPRLGGVAIVGAFYAPILALLFIDSGTGRLFWANVPKAMGLLAGGAIIAALGVYDDVRGANARTKFAVQFAVAGLVYALGYRIDVLANPFGDPIALGWLGFPFTLLWIVGVINAINLIDGLDGLAGGVALVAVLITFVFAMVHGRPLMALTTAALAGAILGFLRYNFNPASIFMGDTGSMFLGFVLAASSIKCHQKSTTAVALLVPIIALGFPITDTLLAMARRYMRGSPLFQADREHIHHRLLARGLSQRQTVLVLYGASAVLGLSAILLTRTSGLLSALVLGAVVLGAAVALRRLGYMRFERTAEVLEVRRRNLRLRTGIREIGDRLRDAATARQVWDSVKAAAPVLGADCVGLRFVEQRAFGCRHVEFADGFDDAGADVLRTRHSLLGERPDPGVLELGWNGGRTTIDRDTEIAVELLCEHVAQALGRVQSAAAPQRPVPVEAMLSPEAANELHQERVASLRR